MSTARATSNIYNSRNRNSNSDTDGDANAMIMVIHGHSHDHGHCHGRTHSQSVGCDGRVIPVVMVTVVSVLVLGRVLVPVLLAMAPAPGSWLATQLHHNAGCLVPRSASSTDNKALADEQAFSQP